MSNPYLDQATIDEAAQAIRDGVTLSVIAGKLRCDESYLANLLGLPQWKQIPAAGDDGGDLWAVDRLDGVL